MIVTTLKSLREHQVCADGYNKLVCSLKGEAFDCSDRETYIHYRHDEPIPLARILESNGLDDALWALRACEQTPELQRAERLFAVWCARQVQNLMADKRSIDAIDVAERHAYGDATDEELDAAWADAAWAAAAWAAASDASWDAQKQKFIEVFCGGEIDLEPLRQAAEVQP